MRHDSPQNVTYDPQFQRPSMLARRPFQTRGRLTSCCPRYFVFHCTQYLRTSVRCVRAPGPADQAFNGQAEMGWQKYIRTWYLLFNASPNTLFTVFSMSRLFPSLQPAHSPARAHTHTHRAQPFLSRSVPYWTIHTPQQWASVPDPRPQPVPASGCSRLSAVLRCPIIHGRTS